MDDFKYSPDNLSLEFNHVAEIACFLMSGLSHDDRAIVKAKSYACQDSRYPDDGYILYVAEEEDEFPNPEDLSNLDTDEDYKDFSNDFKKMLRWCQVNEIAWLRLLP